MRLKLILFAALSAALTVAGLSLAAGGGSGGDNSNDTRSTRDADRRLGPPPGFAMRFDEDVAGVMRDIHEAVEAKAAEIGEPIIQKAEDDGDITAAQADALRDFVTHEGERKPPSRAVRTLFSDRDVRNVLTDVLEAKAEQAPEIAEPIIDKAVGDDKITSAQADDIRERVKNPPFFFHGKFLHGHGPGGRHEFGPFRQGRFDRDVGEVLRDIHEAVEKKAPEIAGPVIQKAEDAGDITSAQADRLREAAQAIADGERPGADVRSLLRDADVRKVVHEAFVAAAKQAPGIAEPIIGKAVDDEKITSAQADDIRDNLKRKGSIRIAPPPFGGPGGPHGSGERRLGPPPGGAPGFFGGDVEPAPRAAEALRPA